MIQTRTNVPLGWTGQQLLLQAQLRLRITVQHVYGHGQNVGNECLDHAAALGALGRISNQNINTRWVCPSFDSTTLLGPSGNTDEMLHVLRKVRRMHTPVARGSVQKLEECLLPCFPEDPCVAPGPRCSIMLCVWLRRYVRVPFIFRIFSVEGLG